MTTDYSIYGVPFMQRIEDTREQPDEALGARRYEMLLKQSEILNYFYAERARLEQQSPEGREIERLDRSLDAFFGETWRSAMRVGWD